MTSSAEVDGDQRSSRSPFARALIAGAFAGATVDISLFPIDTLKTRLQSAEGFRASGGFRGVYSGIGSAIVGSAPGAALFFVNYEGVKKFLRDARVSRSSWSESVEQMTAASIGEIAACAVRVPTEVVKQRAQARQGVGSLGVLKSIWAQRPIIGLNGVYRELYRGWTITIMREVPFTVIQFPIWEGLKAWRRRVSGDATVSAVESGLFGSFAGAIAAGATTPLDVLKTRLMLAKEKESAWQMARHILRTNGPRAFLAGIGPRVFWISAGGAVFLGSYQWVYNLLGMES